MPLTVQSLAVDFCCDAIAFKPTDFIVPLFDNGRMLFGVLNVIDAVLCSSACDAKPTRTPSVLADIELGDGTKLFTGSALSLSIHGHCSLPVAKAVSVITIS